MDKISTWYATGITILKKAATYSASPDIWFQGIFTEKPVAKIKLKIYSDA